MDLGIAGRRAAGTDPMNPTRVQPSVPRRPAVVGVAGGSGSGKTSVVEAIVERVGAERVALLPHDRYYRDRRDLPFEERQRLNVDHPSAYDDDLFVDHLRSLVRGETVDMPRYDYTRFTRVDGSDPVEPRPVVLTEGILLLAVAHLRELIDVKVYVDAAADVRLVRRIRRDVVHRGRTAEEILDQYEATVRPMHLEHVEPSKQRADLVLPGGAENVVGVEVVTTWLESILDGRG